jgi:hypothetical protein
MDQPDYDKSVDDQESTSEYMCQKEAVKNGHTTDQADNCEDGELDCENCPFEIYGISDQREKDIYWSQIVNK